MKKTVQILMSAYNGEKYIKEQLDSIAEQNYPAITLLVRDDASSDATMQILQEYQARYPWIQCYSGENKGACGSFFDLLEHCDETASYYAFCDQDDVWEPDKLTCAVEMLEKQQEKKSLYCSATKLVDEKLNPLLQGEGNSLVKAGFGNAVVENICTGCTAVFSKELRDLIVGRIPQHAYMHDWWLYLVASCFGTVCYDADSRILYRQHGNNTLGGQESLFSHLRRRIRNYGEMKHYVPKQLEEFMQLYGNEIAPDKRSMLEVMIMKQKNPLSRMKIYGRKDIYRNRGMDDFIYKFLFLFWRFGK